MQLFAALTKHVGDMTMQCYEYELLLGALHARVLAIVPNAACDRFVLADALDTHQIASFGALGTMGVRALDQIADTLAEQLCLAA